ncbi:aldo/keto reductase [Euzebya tangerina]|uniref:aldo/keto reductase n=1 Tax=Euzebya tangerina TaxID=591198 RepID=UPI000E32193C|nr:aldo/keto reductase [Euzebya tangerina]
MTAVPQITLNNDVTIPQLGFGTFQIEPEETKEVTLTALQTGYRHIDTAQMYRNEAGVGAAVQASGLDRSEVFVTTKLNNGYHDPEVATKEFESSLERMGFDYVDLFLIHWPLPEVLDYVETWKALEAIYASGGARSIGVSNFQVHHLQRLMDETDVVPVVNQIEVHPYFANDEVREFGTEHGIVTEAWSPIAQGEVIGDETLVEIGEQHGKSEAQVALRWALQRGDIIFPKSTKPERIAENFEIFDFELSEEEMATIHSLDRDGRRGPNPDEFNWIPD